MNMLLRPLKDIMSFLVHRFSKVFISIFSVLGVFFIGLYVFSPWLVQQALETTLKKQGIGVVEFKVDRPTWSGVKLANVNLSSQEWSLAAKDIYLRYNLWSLISDPKLSEVNVGSLSFNLLKLTQTETTEPFSLSEYFPNQWLGLKFFEKVSIERVQLSQQALNGPINEWTGHLTALWHDDALVATLKGQDNLEHQWQVQLSIKADNTVAIKSNLSIAKHDFDVVLNMSGRFLESQLVLNIDFDFGLASLPPWIVEQAPDLLALSKKLEAPWHISFKTIEPMALLFAFDPVLSIETKGNLQLDVVDKQSMLQVLSFDYHGQIFPRVSLKVLSKLEGRVQKKLLSSLLIESTIEHDFDSLQGQLKWHVDDVDSSFLTPAAQLFMVGGDDSFSFTKGTVNANGKAHWAEGQPLKQHVFINLKALAGKSGELSFSGLSTQLSLVSQPTVRLDKKARVFLTQLALGALKANKLNLTLVPTKNIDRLNIQDFEARVWGGKIEIPELLWRKGEVSSFTTKIENLSVKDILVFHDIPGLTGTGRLSGVLPMSITEKGLVVRKGTIKAVDGGIIQYQANEAALRLAAANPQLNTTLQALKNLHYDVLSAEISFLDTGVLIVPLKLTGKNPDFEQGRPIELNINYEQDLLPLLQSLQVIKNVQTLITKRYK